MNPIQEQIFLCLDEIGVKNSELTLPPKPDMGDFAFACFQIAKEQGKNPAEVAKEIESQFKNLKSKVVDDVKAFGPYVNFFLNGKEVAQLILQEIQKQGKKYGTHTQGKNKKIMVEFAHPNTHKAFHIGHLRNIMTGESLVRLHENAGYEVIRANYQGDVGLHIAKCLWGMNQTLDEYEESKTKSLHDRVNFLGKAYAFGAGKYEESEDVQKEVQAYNEKIYTKAPEIQDMYQTTRAWSLEYFDRIYKRVGSHFDRLYFESEVFARGLEIVTEQVKKGVFKESEGAIIFEGEQYGLHSRVFVNSKGFPTYEGKDIGLAELELKEFQPEKIIHVTGREQADYFKVIFKAIEKVFGIDANREQHITYGWVNLKSGKMSARTGKVVLGEWLIDEVKTALGDFMKESTVANKEETIETIALAAVKYGFLKTGVQNDIKFDFDESVSLSGDSGPYLLYICARIKSIVRKMGTFNFSSVPTNIDPAEKQLLLKLSEYPSITQEAIENYDPSKIAKYAFELAQSFNSFYQACPVLQAEEEVKQFRLQVIQNVLQVMEHALSLLGIQTVEEM